MNGLEMQQMLRAALRLVAVDRARIEGLLGVAKLEPQPTARADRRRAIEARAPPGVARAAPALLDLDPDRVLIAIEAQLHDPLHVAGAFALAPEALTRAAEVPGLAGCDRVGERLRIHVRDHQHVTGARVGRH